MLQVTKMSIATFLFGIVLFFARDPRSIENVAIYGKVTCDGNPVEGVQILMVDDNIWMFDHILTFRSTNKNGKYRLFGNPHDKDLNLLLIVEHSCHENRNIKTRELIESYSQYRIPLHTLEEHGFDYEFNIELRNNHGVHSSKPGLYAWRAAADIKTVASDSAEYLKNAFF
ncbi:unnamed protein product [Caenorhabditis angaria]|uniref:Transthyretin-like family protein n=1 Tax=Caenorhabditis angaria TaxID=860376 RepID=A0A9P1IDJ3_9PELO|nr:unnamed protein product [Caenorhabditis angaria]